MKSDRLDVFPDRFGIESSDPDLIQKHLDQTYSARFAISRPGTGGCSLAHSRIDVGGYAIEDIRHTGEALLRADRVPSVVALFVLNGHVEAEHGRLTGSAGPGQWLLASSGVGGVRVRLRDAQLRSVVVARPLLTEVAAIDTAAAAVPRFTGLVPVSAGAARTLATTERFLSRLLTDQEDTDNRILLASAGRLLASALLTAFPNDLPPEDVPADADAFPVLLRQAIEFIQDNAAHDIGVSDVAAALYLSPRTVQYMFRRHLDTTPTAYLRDIRLARAREELIASDRSVTTVAATAARWGFAHTGRFAVIYRRAFGESPHETLRR
ncbi:helix-turn-helix transcriptional regulator [Mycobacterium sp. AMU20-3851]|uniref:helix-turn-helix transcriptional regulator n=1 Tax=Mycobacterium sp. AMU20-3851 TaxID=3122055 RepID=UPI0037543E5E